MKFEKVPGRNKKHRVRMYALSTCGWCKMTKKFLRDSEIEYEYVDVDLCTDQEQDSIEKEMRKRGRELRFPTVVVDDNAVIVGYREDEIKEVLGI